MSKCSRRDEGIEGPRGRLAPRKPEVSGHAPEGSGRRGIESQRINARFCVLEQPESISALGLAVSHERSYGQLSERNR